MLATPRKRKHIEIVPKQTERREYDAFPIDNSALTKYDAEIQYMFSKAPTSQIHLLGNLLSDAIQTSHHWRMERSLGEPATDCLTTMIPKDPTQDTSVTLWVGPE